MKAWEEAYNFLAKVLIDREQALREELESKEGGWSGFRNFVVKKKVLESYAVASFYLEPEDGKAVLRHKPVSWDH